MTIRLYIITALLGLFPSSYSMQSKQLNLLLNDLKRYKFSAPTYDKLGIHAGHLWEHSLWAHYAAGSFIASKSPYTQGVSERVWPILSLAALLHDIGKAGRIELFNGTHSFLKYDLSRSTGTEVIIDFDPDREEHCVIGFEYVGGRFFSPTESSFKQRSYLIYPEATFNFAAMFQELGIDDEDQKLIAIMIGMHYDLGNIDNPTATNHLTKEQYLARIKRFATAVQYQRSVDEELIRLAVLVHLADVQGLYPCQGCCSSAIMLEVPRAIEPVRPPWATSPFQRFGYELKDGTSRAFKLMSEIIALYYANN